MDRVGLITYLDWLGLFGAAAPVGRHYAAQNRSLAALLATHEIRHLTTRPYRPRTNGKVERFHQTMARE